MTTLKAELSKLRKTGMGNSSLVSELESLIEATANTKDDDVSLSRKFLALAAQEIRNQKFGYAHDCIGASVEAYHSEQADSEVEVSLEVQARLEKVEVSASSDPFILPLPELTENPEFEESPSEVVTAFADLLINASYADEAKAYISAYNEINDGKESMSKRKNLDELRNHFKNSGNLAMAKAAEDMLEEVGVEAEEVSACESRANAIEAEANESDDDQVKASLVKASFLMKAASAVYKDPSGDKDHADKMVKAAEEMYEEAKANNETKMNEEDTMSQPKGNATASDKPVLYVEPASQQEEGLKVEAATALKVGDKKKAQKCLAQAQEMEKMRLVAALIEAGDMELAMEGLNDEAANAGFAYSEEEAKKNEEAAQDTEDAMNASEMPEGELAADDASKEPEAPESEDEEAPADEPVPSEEEMAKDMTQEVAASVKRKNMKKAVIAFTKLTDLESEIVAGIKIAKQFKDAALAAEGKQAWKAVRKQRLTAEVILASAEGDLEAKQEASEGMKALEDNVKADEALQEALDDTAGEEAEAQELTEDVIVPPGGLEESLMADEMPMAMDDDMAGEEDEEAPPAEEVSEAMHYEVLQSIDDVKGLKIDREALAFTYWEDEKGVSPYYVVQAAGKPIAEIHLGDQDNAADIRAYFCDEGRYTQAIAQTVENTSLYEMLRGVRARFYANQVDKSSYAKRMKDEALASVSGVRQEKLADLRNDFVDAMLISAEALNKGLMNKPHALKGAFAKILSSYGISNPAIAVESAFKEAGQIWFEQVVEGAAEYLEMPKEAFAHARRMVEQANNVAFTSASNLMDSSIGHRLSQNSLPFGSVPSAFEAPVREAEIQASVRDNSERAKIDTLKRKIRLSSKF